MNEENKNLDETIKRYIDIAAEKFEDKLKILKEGQDIILEKVEKIDSLVEDMDYVKSEIVEIKDRFKEVDAELDKKAEKEKVSDHETRITSLESTALAKA
jgi:uncharacterized membrane protein